MFGKNKKEDKNRFDVQSLERIVKLERLQKLQNLQNLQNLKRKYIWLVLAEGWCADGSQILPILNKMAHESGKIELKIVLPEENEDLMDLFLLCWLESSMYDLLLNRS